MYQNVEKSKSLATNKWPTKEICFSVLNVTKRRLRKEMQDSVSVAGGSQRSWRSRAGRRQPGGTAGLRRGRSPSPHCRLSARHRKSHSGHLVSPHHTETWEGRKNYPNYAVWSDPCKRDRLGRTKVQKTITLSQDLSWKREEEKGWEMLTARWSILDTSPLDTHEPLKEPKPYQIKGRRRKRIKNAIVFKNPMKKPSLKENTTQIEENVLQMVHTFLIKCEFNFKKFKEEHQLE